MGHIVKAACLLPSSACVHEGAVASTPAVVDREAGLAAVTELLVAARVAARMAADEERAAAKDAGLALARKMAEKIVGRAVELEPSIMGEIAEQALAACRARVGALVLRVHPDDLVAIEQTRAHWMQRVAATASVRVVADASVGRDGCVVETPVGRLDARLQTQLDALERAVRGAGLGRV